MVCFSILVTNVWPGCCLSPAMTLSLSHTHQSTHQTQSTWGHQCYQQQFPICLYDWSNIYQCFVLLSSLSPSPFLFISPSFCPLLYLCFAHPLGCLWHPFPAIPGCAPLTVSFTRVSPVSSFSICKPHAALGPRTPTQSQQRSKERPAYFCVCRCHFQYDTGEQMMHGNFHFEIGGGGYGFGVTMILQKSF